MEKSRTLGNRAWRLVRALELGSGWQRMKHSPENDSTRVRQLSLASSFWKALTPLSWCGTV